MHRHNRLAGLLRLLAVVLLVLFGLILWLSAAAWLEGLVRERSQRLEQLADPVD